jgi:hypothetical protein
VTKDLVEIVVALRNLIESSDSIENVRDNEIYSDLEEWLNENG